MIPTIAVTDSPELHLRQAIALPLIGFNEARSGQRLDWRPLAILVSDPGSKAVVGGLWGGSYFSYLWIDLLFLPETLRGAGLGRRIMIQAEEEAVRRGCTGVWLDTFSFQARGFYERLGYAVFGTIDDHPPGHSRFFLKKVL
ncbi:MAG: GNAT family N-acetyltransferase [Proteobacteria bacterium]|nr:GNAT family N-acetyltransferase [Pseudomonadota bacterium]